MKKTLKTLLCLMLCVCIGISAVIIQNMIPVDTSAEASDEMAELQKKLKELKEKQDELDAQYDEAKGKTEAQLEVKMLLEQELESINSEIGILETIIDGITSEIDTLNAELGTMEADYEANLAAFRKRARAEYEGGSASYLEILLTSSNIADMLKRIEFAKNVAEYDKRLLTSLQAQMNEIDETRSALQEKQSEQQSALNEVESAKTRQLVKISEVDDAIAELKANEKYIVSQQNKYEDMEEELEKEIAKLASSSGVYSGDELIWPVPGYSRISSGYGWRTLYGKPNYHKAIDIPAPSGTKVVAAQAGKVIFAAWVTTGGGNHITIDHGGGLITHYNHLSGYAVSAGDYVAQGQVIGYVGTTGNSTGNHLDFRIYCNGTYYNPALFVNPTNSKPTQSIHTLIG